MFDQRVEVTVEIMSVVSVCCAWCKLHFIFEVDSLITEPESTHPVMDRLI